MNKKDVVKSLLIHKDQTVSCDNCPAKDLPDCWDKVLKETIKILERGDS